MQVDVKAINSEAKYLSKDGKSGIEEESTSMKHPCTSGVCLDRLAFSYCRDENSMRGGGSTAS